MKNLPIISLIIFFIVPQTESQSYKAINLSNLRVYESDSAVAAPDDVSRLRVIVTKTETSSSSSSLIVIHIVRLRWSPPLRWRDGGGSRNYQVLCELSQVDSGKSVTLLERTVSSDVTGIDERFVLPRTRLTLLCGVRSTNQKKLSSKFKYSKLVSIDNTQHEHEEKKDKKIEEKIKEKIEEKTMEKSEDIPSILNSVPKGKDQNGFQEPEVQDSASLLELIHNSQLIDLPPIYDLDHYRQGRKENIIVPFEPSFTQHEIEYERMTENSLAQTVEEIASTPRSAQEKSIDQSVEEIASQTERVPDNTGQTDEEIALESERPAENESAENHDIHVLADAQTAREWRKEETEREVLTEEEEKDYEELENKLRKAVGASESTKKELQLEEFLLPDEERLSVFERVL